MKIKHTLRAISLFLVLLSALFFQPASAQQNCTLVNSLTINTGINAAGNTVAIGQNDPYWTVTSMSNFMQTVPGVVAQGQPAITITPAVPWATNNFGRYISCLANNSFFTPQTDSVYSMTVTRTFRTCVADNYQFNLSVAADNRIVSVNVNGGASQFSQGTITNHNAFQTVPPFSVPLAPGLHTLSVTIQNWTAIQQEQNNWFGFALNGTINGSLNSIASPACQNICPPPNCSDTCYWKVTGNNILNGNNILGTMSSHDIRIFSGGTQRGVIRAGGFFGWKTANPSTLFHIECSSPIAPSNIRFENLTRGIGDPLMIDANGYVFRGRNVIPVDKETVQALNAQIESLTLDNEKLNNEVMRLRNEVNGLLGRKGVSNDMESKGSVNVLSQNRPNPFGGATTIDFVVAGFRSSAFIMISDLSGKELLRYKIGTQGKGNIQVDSGALSSGLYIYSLIVDGVEVDTKKMTVIKN